ncbi:hypothetical protein AWB80_07467 [Caballeronia pedi]|uniref:Uncharacterized protein n=1 Tax=Caballeronia pedi TaxID=1777141 RepID=A0A158DVB8_9BURK|nr:hypothetical protein [Caballeronia pedi]SAK98136.1 hypothetical protein AWB80_07467 [Caballeronia pedi]
MTEEANPDVLLQAMRDANETLYELVQLELPNFTEKDFYAAFILPTRDSGTPSSLQLRDDFLANQDTMSMTEGRLSVIRIGCAYIGEAITYRLRDRRDQAWKCVAESNYWLGIVLSTYYMTVPQQRLHADVSRKGALGKLAKDPKQAEKSFIKQCWDDWQDGKTHYKKGKAGFARDMLAKVEHLESQKTIEDWCRDWEREKQILAGTSSILPAD